jgi:hypothetical protein
MTPYVYEEKGSSMSIKARVVVLALSSTILGFVLTGTAAASRQPFMASFDVEQTITIDCGTFTLHEEGVDHVRVILFFDSNGVPGPLQIHHNGTGVITNPEGETFVDRVAATELIDIAGDFDQSNDTERLVGKEFGITIPGAGIVAHDTGVITFYPDGSVTFQGPHDVFVQGDALLCAALG